jgi:hypothetical protein
VRKLEVECPDCSQTVIPQWNPFEGCWSCPDCYSDDLDDVVREAEGDYSGAADCGLRAHQSKSNDVTYSYLQDGGDFYVKDGDTLVAVIKYPTRVKDGDLEKAQWAETWFLNLMETWRVNVTREPCL